MGKAEAKGVQSVVPRPGKVVDCFETGDPPEEALVWDIPPPDPSSAPAAWQTSILACFQDTPGCVEVSLCSYCELGFQYSTVQHEQQSMHPAACCAPLMADLLMVLLSPVWWSPGLSLTTHYVRRRLREKFHITPNQGVQEFWTAVLCSLCALCQQRRELVLRGLSPGSLFRSDSELH
jgi:Cys-rich protein (TIGR01571 family)